MSIIYLGGQALLLLLRKLMFNGVMLLKMALDYVSYSSRVIPRARNVPLRVSLVHNVLENNVIDFSASEVQTNWLCTITQSVLKNCSLPKFR